MSNQHWHRERIKHGPVHASTVYAFRALYRVVDDGKGRACQGFQTCLDRRWLVFAVHTRGLVTHLRRYQNRQQRIPTLQSGWVRWHSYRKRQWLGSWRKSIWENKSATSTRSKNRMIHSLSASQATSRSFCGRQVVFWESQYNPSRQLPLWSW